MNPSKIEIEHKVAEIKQSAICIKREFTKFRGLRSCEFCVDRYMRVVRMTRELGKYTTIAKEHNYEIDLHRMDSAKANCWLTIEYIVRHAYHKHKIKLPHEND